MFFFVRNYNFLQRVNGFSQSFRKEKALISMTKILSVIPKFDSVLTHWPCHMSCPTLHVSTIHVSSAVKSRRASPKEGPQKDTKELLPLSWQESLALGKWLPRELLNLSKQRMLTPDRHPPPPVAAHHRRIGCARTRRAPSPGEGCSPPTSSTEARRAARHLLAISEQWAGELPVACSLTVSRAARPCRAAPRGWASSSPPSAPPMVGSPPSGCSPTEGTPVGPLASREHGPQGVAYP